MVTATCENCKWWGSVQTGQNRHCRKSAPIAVVHQPPPGRQIVGGQPQGLQLLTIWPLTGPDQYCGDFQERKMD